mmetsp:Transcript_104428/g.196621  ORF Transcript_104428/g.196621 Transcript_104428/m.196621 type:complete len:391 (+) Transcript_104428:77-1249(+)
MAMWMIARMLGLMTVASSHSEDSVLSARVASEPDAPIDYQQFLGDPASLLQTYLKLNTSSRQTQLQQSPSSEGGSNPRRLSARINATKDTMDASDAFGVAGMGDVKWHGWQSTLLSHDAMNDSSRSQKFAGDYVLFYSEKNRSDAHRNDDRSGFSFVLSNIISGLSMKICLGLDDLVWLTPLLAQEKTRTGKTRVVLLYGMCTVIIVGLAVGLGSFAAAYGDARETICFWISLGAGCLLVGSSLIMAFEEGWFRVCGFARDTEDDDSKDDNAEYDTDSVNAVMYFFLGSLDDLSVLFLLGMSGIYTWYTLVVGTFVGSLILASIGMLATESETISSYLKRIPVCWVLFMLGLYVLIMAFLPDDNAEFAKSKLDPVCHRYPHLDCCILHGS